MTYKWASSLREAPCTAAGAGMIAWSLRYWVSWKACVSRTTAVKISLLDLENHAVVSNPTTHNNRKFDTGATRALAAVRELSSLAHNRL